MKTLVIYANDGVKEMLEKSNLWYIRHYESYFDHVYMVYLRGSAHESVTQGRTTLVSVSTGRGKLDFLLAPFRLCRLARKVRATAYITPDQLYSWWLSWAMQLFLRAKIYLLPQFIPEQIYANSKRSVSIRFPIWLERIMVRLSYAFADHVLTANNFGSTQEWLRAYPVAARKMVVADVLVEALPPHAFLEKLEQISRDGSIPKEPGLKLIYVGRLQQQKMVDGLIKMMPIIRDGLERSMSVSLTLIGDGPDRGSLEQMARELGVAHLIKFAGQLRNEDLPEHLARADIYVSPLTGMSFREAALFGMPIVAYDIDWLKGYLKHEETALLVPSGDYEEMARQVLRLARDRELRQRLSKNIKDFAWKVWSPTGLPESLRQVFEKVA